MEIHEKIKLMRCAKGWTQEEMADKLEMSMSGYGSIERGETDIPLSRLKEITKIYQIDISELFDFQEKNIFHFNGSDYKNHFNNWYSNVSKEQQKVQHELEKKQLN